MSDNSVDTNAQRIPHVSADSGKLLRLMLLEMLQRKDDNKGEIDEKKQAKKDNVSTWVDGLDNDGTTKTEHYIDDTPDQEYDYCAFYMGNDRYAHFGRCGWLAVADLTEYDDDYRNAVNDLDAGDFDASQAADIIRKGIKTGDLLIAKSHNPIEAMRLLCEKLDAR